MTCLYIGDRFDDYKSSIANNIPFILAEWGYEKCDSEIPPHVFRLNSPDAKNIIQSFLSSQ